MINFKSFQTKYENCWQSWWGVYGRDSLSRFEIHATYAKLQFIVWIEVPEDIDITEKRKRDEADLAEFREQKKKDVEFKQHRAEYMRK